VFVEGGRLCHGTMAQWPVQAYDYDNVWTAIRQLRPFDNLRYDWSAALLPK